jgi:hypothetical protein
MMRLARMGFMENRVLPAFGYYPWVCGACHTRKYFRFRVKRIHRPPLEE